jgi:hypothetical protein
MADKLTMKGLKAPRIPRRSVPRKNGRAALTPPSTVTRGLSRSRQETAGGPGQAIPGTGELNILGELDPVSVRVEHVEEADRAGDLHDGADCRAGRA